MTQSTSPIANLLIRIWLFFLGLYYRLVGNSKSVFIAETNLPTLKGLYRVRAYRTLGGPNGMEPIAIICGNIEGQKNVPLRVHDACFTSEVIGSKKCDCREQLHWAMDYIKEQGTGIVIYLQQEGRGIGLANKIAAYSLQEVFGYDTVDANRMLGLPDDTRDYRSVKDILTDLRVQSVNLLTNNPRKIGKLTDLGIKIEDRVPVLVQPNSVNIGYMKTKQKRMSHLYHDHLTTTEVAQ